jgi:hypothetical protein
LARDYTVLASIHAMPHSAGLRAASCLRKSFGDVSKRTRDAFADQFTGFSGGLVK